MVSALLSLFLGQWQPFVTLLGQLIAYWMREKPTGLFEILEYDSTLEIHDPQGHLATVNRLQSVRYLQDYVIAFQDHAWGDGEVLADYKISPGVVVDKYREGNRWNILVSLRETKSKGEVEDFHIERTVKDAFIQDVEWYQTEIWLPVRHVRLSVIFPQSRPCTRAVLLQRSNNKRIQLDNRNFATLPDGRTLLTWEKSYPKRAEVYTLQWEW